MAMIKRVSIAKEQSRSETLVPGATPKRLNPPSALPRSPRREILPDSSVRISPGIRNSSNNRERSGRQHSAERRRRVR